jgi:hypothetical protein
METITSSGVRGVVYNHSKLRCNGVESGDVVEFVRGDYSEMRNVRIASLFRVWEQINLKK